MRDFSPATLRALARKGITVLRPVAIPDRLQGWLNPDRGYAVNDGGCHRILTHAQVLEEAGR